MTDNAAFADGTAFALEAVHLGQHRRRDEISLHARVSATIDRIRADAPGCVIEVLDFQGDRVAVPAPGIDFVGPVEMFDVPREAPRQVVVFGADAAARFGEAFPDMARCPFGGAGTASRSPWRGTIWAGTSSASCSSATSSVRRLTASPAMPACHGGRCWTARAWRSGPPIRASGPIDNFDGLNGFEPRYLVFHDRRAAEAFGKQFPTMGRERLAEASNNLARGQEGVRRGHPRCVCSATAADGLLAQAMTVNHSAALHQSSSPAAPRSRIARMRRADIRSSGSRSATFARAARPSASRPNRTST